MRSSSSAGSALTSEEVGIKHSTLISEKDLLVLFSSFDLTRLDVFSKNLVDYYLVSDLMPQVARLFFTGRLYTHSQNSETQMPVLQQALLLGRTLQSKPIEKLAFEYGMPTHQVTSQLNKTLTKLLGEIKRVQLEEATREVDASEGMKKAKTKQERLRQGESILDVSRPPEEDITGTVTPLDPDEVRRRNELVSSLDLAEYEIQGEEEEWVCCFAIIS
jgi:N-acetyltransferase 10